MAAVLLAACNQRALSLSRSSAKADKVLFTFPAGSIEATTETSVYKAPTTAKASETYVVSIVIPIVPGVIAYLLIYQPMPTFRFP